MGGKTNPFKAIEKAVRKVRNSIEKTLRNPLSLPKRMFKNMVLKPTKQIAKEYLRVQARVTREVFSQVSRITGIKWFDKIGDGAYLLSMAMSKGDWKAIGAAVAVVASIALTIVTWGGTSSLVGAAVANAISVANIAFTAVAFATQLYTLGGMYQHGLQMRAMQTEYNDTGYETIADKSKWLAGGELRNNCLAGGILLNASTLIDPNAKAFGYPQPELDTTLLNPLRMPYADRAGGIQYAQHLGGADDWRPKQFVKYYYTPKDPVEELYKDMGIISRYG